MISIGGVIGTGLFLGTPLSLHHAGPLGLWLGYLVMGSVCYAMMMCLGEMISYLPVPGGHIKLSERFVGKPLSFAMGWNYWYNWVIVLPAELSAAAVLMSYWSDLNPAIWISIFLVVVVAINLLGTRAYGEAEFWFASIKIITIVGLIILSVCIDLGVGKQGRLGFRFWKEPVPLSSTTASPVPSVASSVSSRSSSTLPSPSSVPRSLPSLPLRPRTPASPSLPPSARSGSVSSSSTSSVPS